MISNRTEQADFSGKSERRSATELNRLISQVNQEEDPQQN
jgi:hypothetical protein